MQKIDGKLLKTAFFLKQGYKRFKLDRKWGFNLVQTRTKAKSSTNSVFCHCKIIIFTKFRA